MAMIRIRKDKAGDASGHDDGTGRPWSFDWSEDGAVVEVPYAVALELLREPQWGYTEAGEADDEQDDTKPADDSKTVEEPAAADKEFSESPAPRKPAAKPAKKAAAPEPPPAKE